MYPIEDLINELGTLVTSNELFPKPKIQRNRLEHLVSTDTFFECARIFKEISKLEITLNVK